MSGKTRITLSNTLFFSWVEEEMAAGHNVRFAVKGYSMMPLLRSETDEVELVPPGDSEARVGDILLFRYKGNHILHRVIAKSYSAQKGCCRYILRGDNVIGRREYAFASDVVGRVRYVYIKVADTGDGRQLEAGKNNFTQKSPFSTGYKLRLLFWRARSIAKIMVKRVLGM